MINFIIEYFKNRKKKYFKLARKGKWQTHDKKILELEDQDGYRVAHWLAMHNKNWSTDETKILELENKYGNTVAHYLAMFKEKWNTNDPEILRLENKNGKTVQDILERRGK